MQDKNDNHEQDVRRAAEVIDLDLHDDISLTTLGVITDFGLLGQRSRPEEWSELGAGAAADSLDDVAALVTMPETAWNSPAAQALIRSLAVPAYVIEMLAEHGTRVFELVDEQLQDDWDNAVTALEKLVTNLRSRIGE